MVTPSKVMKGLCLDDGSTSADQKPSLMQTKSENLQTKALQYCKDKIVEFKHCKHPPQHFRQKYTVMYRDTTEPLYELFWRRAVDNQLPMYPYVSMHSGHQDSILHQEPFSKMPGIHFTLTVRDDSRDDAPVSPFGPERIEVPIHAGLDPEKYNLYFVDFYLPAQYMKGRQYRYIQLVAVERDSIQDLTFRDAGLEPLDLETNPLVRYTPTPMRDEYGKVYHEYTIVSTWYLFIYVYCMFAVDLHDAEHITDVPAVDYPVVLPLDADEDDATTNVGLDFGAE